MTHYLTHYYGLNMNKKKFHRKIINIDSRVRIFMFILIRTPFKEKQKAEYE